MTRFTLILSTILFLFLASTKGQDKTITLTVPDKKLSITIDYSNGCLIKQLNIKGKNTLSSSGVYTGIRTSDGSFSSAASQHIKVTKNAGTVTISGISYGPIKEKWIFKVKGDKIQWDITREYNQALTLEEMAFPQWNFSGLAVWKGGIMDNGGISSW